MYELIQQHFGRSGGRRLSLVITALVAVITATLAALPASIQSANQSYIAPADYEASATELGRARQVATFATMWKQDTDPLITTPDGHQVKSSNYNGVMIGGVVYYYSLAPHISYDPLSRGEVTMNQIVVKERIEADEGFPILVYTIPR